MHHTVCRSHFSLPWRSMPLKTCRRARLGVYVLEHRTSRQGLLGIFLPPPRMPPKTALQTAPPVTLVHQPIANTGATGHVAMPLGSSPCQCYGSNHPSHGSWTSRGGKGRGWSLWLPRDRGTWEPTLRSRHPPPLRVLFPRVVTVSSAQVKAGG